MLNILVLDDNEQDIERLIQSLHQAMEGKLEYHLTCLHHSEALELTAQRYDIYFLDIDLPGKDGISVAKQIREWNHDAIVIFVTRHDNLVFQSFEVNPFQFVRKNYFADDFRSCAELLMKRFHDAALFYSFQFNSVVTNVRYRDILYFEKRKNDLYIYTTDAIHRNRDNLSYVEMKINHPKFIRIHHSYLVNLDYVKQLNEHMELWNGIKLPVSRSKAKNVKERYLMYLKRTL